MQSTVCIHPQIVGELACGSLQSRRAVLDLLQALPGVTVASDSEALRFIESASLMGRGIGYIDVHLLAACKLSGARLWTRDKRLRQVAQELDLAWGESEH